jgi:hypothetical protein
MKKLVESNCKGQTFFFFWIDDLLISSIEFSVVVPNLSDSKIRCQRLRVRNNWHLDDDLEAEVSECNEYKLNR